MPTARSGHSAALIDHIDAEVLEDVFRQGGIAVIPQDIRCSVITDRCGIPQDIRRFICVVCSKYFRFSVIRRFIIIDAWSRDVSLLKLLFFLLFIIQQLRGIISVILTFFL